MDLAENRDVPSGIRLDRKCDSVPPELQLSCLVSVEELVKRPD